MPPYSTVPTGPQRELVARLMKLWKLEARVSRWWARVQGARQAQKLYAPKKPKGRERCGEDG